MQISFHMHLMSCHAFPRRRTAEIAGQVTAQRLNMTDFLCNDNAIEHSVCGEYKRGTRIREGLALK